MTDAVLRRLAGEQAYNRGLDYFKHGHVESIESRNGVVYAIVRGDLRYAVTLASDDGILDYSCDCSSGVGGVFCMHCAAAALAWLDQATGQAKKPKRLRARKVTLDDARTLLEAQDKESLVNLVLGWAKEDERIQDRLILYAARRSGPDAGASALKQTFEKAVKLRGRINYRESKIWSQGVGAAIDSIEQFLKDGHASASVGVCESALELLRTNSCKVEEPAITCAPLLTRLLAVHYEACDDARPDPDVLAKTLLGWELIGDGKCRLAQYSEILGERGRNAYRTHAEAVWEKLPPKVQTDRIARVMERLAGESGDIDWLAAVLSRSLRYEGDYLKIANLYRDAGKSDMALFWAYKGMTACPTYAQSALTAFAIEEYHSRGNHNDAMKLAWEEFIKTLTVDAYKTLEKDAVKAGAWPEWREQALAEIRKRLAMVKNRSAGRSLPASAWLFGDHSMLVEIFLYEKNSVEARREAELGGCSDKLLVKLEDLRADEYPEEFAGAYMGKVESLIASRNYPRAIALLGKAAGTMRRLGRGPEFKHRLNTLLAKYKGSRAFIVAVQQNQNTILLAD